MEVLELCNKIIDIGQDGTIKDQRARCDILGVVLDEYERRVKCVCGGVCEQTTHNHTRLTCLSCGKTLPQEGNK